MKLLVQQRNLNASCGHQYNKMEAEKLINWKSQWEYEDKAAHALTVLMFNDISFLPFCQKSMYNSFAKWMTRFYHGKIYFAVRVIRIVCNNSNSATD